MIPSFAGYYFRHSPEEPLLYNGLYRRKDAYLRLHEYLLERSGLDKQ